VRPVPSVTTSDEGAFRFDDVQQLNGQQLQLQRDGYGTVTVTVHVPTQGGPVTVDVGGVDVNLGNGICAVIGSGSCALTAPLQERPDAVALEVRLAQSRMMPFAGWVYGAGVAASGATVQLLATGVAHGGLAYTATADVTGHFLFPSVDVGEYEVVVLPYDLDGDDVFEYQAHHAPTSRTRRARRTGRTRASFGRLPMGRRSRETRVRTLILSLVVGISLAVQAGATGLAPARPVPVQQNEVRRAYAVPLPPPPPPVAALAAKKLDGPDLHLRAVAVSPGEALAWSLAMPGVGQMRSRRVGAGVAWMGATAAALAGIIVVGVEASEAARVYEAAPMSARAEAREQAADFAAARNALIVTTACIWALSAVDGWLFHPDRR
jgi:hypothetical protein